jgi:protein-tyrosine phosphatase
VKLFSHRAARNDAGIFRQIPLDVRGKLFVSPMPFGAYDTGNRVLDLYRENRVTHVFVIATDEEIKRKARRDIKKEYARVGISHRQFPVVDMTAPDLAGLGEVVQDAIERLKTSRVAVHCHAGVGRTSVLTCCIVRQITGMTPTETITYVKRHMAVDMTSEQASIVARFVPITRESALRGGGGDPAYAPPTRPGFRR